MKVKFSVREKLYEDIEFEIECESQEQVEEALDEIGDDVSSDDLAMALYRSFGSKNVKFDGNNADNIYPADECEFWDWLDD